MSEENVKKESKGKPLLKLLFVIVTIAGFASALITIYSALYIYKKADFTIEILSSTNVLDVKAEISKLDIFYNGSSLKEKKATLRIILIRVINKGNQDIIINSYDEKDPTGFEIINGNLLEKPEIVSYSNDYFKRNLRPAVDSVNKVYLGKLIMEPEENYVLKLLVMNNNSATPTIRAIGKIAGQKEINVIDYEKKGEETFLTKIFDGAYYIHIARLLFYLIALLITALFVIGAIKLLETLSRLLNKAKRKRIYNKYIKINFIRPRISRGITPIENKILDSYVKNKDPYWEIKNIFEIIETFKDEVEINTICKKAKELEEKENEIKKEIEPVEAKYKKLSDKIAKNKFAISHIEEMIKYEALKKEGDNLMIDEYSVSCAKVLKSFLVENDRNIREKKK